MCPGFENMVACGHETVYIWFWRLEHPAVVYIYEHYFTCFHILKEVGSIFLGTFSYVNRRMTR
jgi:hypothetical protein